MKKLIMILSTFVLTSSTASTLIACGKTNRKNDNHTNSNPEGLTARQKADDAAEELEELPKITVSIGNDEKNEADVITHIKNATEVEKILTKYKANIKGKLTLILLNGSDIKDGAVLKVSGKLKVGNETVDFVIPNVIITVNASSDKQKAEQAAEELKSLPNITVSVGKDQKTKDKLIDHIKNVREIKNIINKYEATIEQLAVKLFNNLDLKDSDIEDGLVLKFSGTLKVENEPADFEIPNVMLKIIGADAMHKQEANEAVDNLNKLKGITFKASELTGNKVDDLKKKLKDDHRIKAIIKNNIEVKGGKFTLKVGDSFEDRFNLDVGKVVTVSGEIEVNGQISDKQFSFDIKLVEKNDKEIANEKVEELDQLNDITIKFGISANLNVGGVDLLNEALFADWKIGNIVNYKRFSKSNDVEGGKFTLTVNDVNASDSDIIPYAVITVSGKIKINGQISDNKFKFNVELMSTNLVENGIAIMKKVADEISKLSSKNIEFKESNFKFGKSKKSVLIKKLLDNTDLKNILEDDMEIWKNLLVLKVGNDEADNINIKPNTIVTVMGFLYLSKGEIKGPEFSFTVKIIE